MTERDITPFSGVGSSEEWLIRESSEGCEDGEDSENSEGGGAVLGVGIAYGEVITLGE